MSNSISSKTSVEQDDVVLIYACAKRLLVLMHKTSLVNEGQKYASWFNLNFNRLSSYHHFWPTCLLEN